MVEPNSPRFALARLFEGDFELFRTVDGVVYDRKRTDRMSSSDSSAARRASERLWLEQLISPSKGYGMTSNLFDARAYVVSLNRDPIKPSDPLTWIDVVVKGGRYFHPVGVNGWPAIARAYIEFRWHAEFRSVHFVEAVDITDHIQSIDPRWPDTSSPHFVYRLGSPMAPAQAMKLGNIHPSMRNWISIDLLVSGAADDYGHAAGGP
jgi:hypothetical protein